MPAVGISGSQRSTRFNGNLNSGGITPITVVGVLVIKSTAPHDAGVLLIRTV